MQVLYCRRQLWDGTANAVEASKLRGGESLLANAKKDGGYANTYTTLLHSEDTPAFPPGRANRQGRGREEKSRGER